MTQQERLHLSEHFTLYEMMRSGTAIENNIPNIPNLQQEQSLRHSSPKCIFHRLYKVLRNCLCVVHVPPAGTMAVPGDDVQI